jgi:septum formation protein
VQDSEVDEDRIKVEFLSQGKPIQQLPTALAVAKALNIDAPFDAIVIGADQIMEMDGKLFDKPKTMSEARERLLDMRGKEHRLVGSVVTVRAGQQLWQHDSITRLQVRHFSETFIDTYLEEEGDEILHCVGGYKFEGRGAHLFERVDGDFFSILGLSLLPLLAHLRDIGAVQS